MKVYISGPISGLDVKRVEANFAEAERVIREAGHTPVSPLNNGVPQGASWEEHMKEDVKLCMDSDSVLMLYDWKRSRGCRIEHTLACEMGKAIYYSFAAFRKTTNNSNN